MMVDGQVRAGPDVTVIGVKTGSGWQFHPQIGDEEYIHRGLGNVTGQKVPIEVVRMANVGAIKILTTGFGITVKDANRQLGIDDYEILLTTNW
jgi:hypothetical protein